MGEITKIYNSVIEVAMRCLVVLNHSPRKTISLEEIMILDHLSLNTFDVGGPVSLHAPIPNRGVQIYSRKEIISKSLKMLLSKDLIQLNPTPEGFRYVINTNGREYLKYFESDYFMLLKERVMWISIHFGNKDAMGLKSIIATNLTKWGEEFMSAENQCLKL